jgi:hypothetical protein
MREELEFQREDNRMKIMMMKRELIEERRQWYCREEMRQLCCKDAELAKLHKFFFNIEANGHQDASPGGGVARRQFKPTPVPMTTPVNALRRRPSEGLWWTGEWEAKFLRMIPDVVTDALTDLNPHQLVINSSSLLD